MVLLLHFAPSSPTVQKSEHDIVLGPKVLRGEMRTFISRPPRIPRWSHMLLMQDRHAHSYASLLHCRLLGRREGGRLRTWRSNIQPPKKLATTNSATAWKHTLKEDGFKGRTQCKDRKMYFHNQLQFMFFPQTWHVKSKKARRVWHYQSSLLWGWLHVYQCTINKLTCFKFILYLQRMLTAPRRSLLVTKTRVYKTILCFRRQARHRNIKNLIILS